MRRIVLLLLLASLFLLPLSGCSVTGADATTLLGELMSLASPLPAGAVYRSDLFLYEDGGILDAALVAALYARADGFCEYEARVERAAVFLSHGAEPYVELGVFSCYGSADAPAVAEMCLRRARLLGGQVALREEEAVVVISGRLVILCLSTDAAVREAVASRYGR